MSILGPFRASPTILGANAINDGVSLGQVTGEHIPEDPLSEAGRLPKAQNNSENSKNVEEMVSC